MDDTIVNGTRVTPAGAPLPLALFRAARIDYSLHRLRHYTGTSPEHFQNFVIFTNYQFYVDAFVQSSLQRLAAGEEGLEAFVAPGNVITRSALAGGGTIGTASERVPQMPAFHLVEPGYRGITLINIGIGPSNARNIIRSRRGAAAACLADDRALRWLTQHAAARRLRAGPWLCPRGSHD